MPPLILVALPASLKEYYYSIMLETISPNIPIQTVYETCQILLSNILPFPFSYELTKKLYHYIMPLFCDAFGSGGVHHIFEQ